LRQFREVTGTPASPTEATDEERADADDALANEIEAAIQPNLDRWLTLRRRPRDSDEIGDHRPTSRFVPFSRAGGDEAAWSDLTKDSPNRLWALLSGPSHALATGIWAEHELVADWEAIPDTPLGPKAHVPPCLNPGPTLKGAKPKPTVRKSYDKGDAPWVAVDRAELVALAVHTFVAAGAITTTQDHAGKLYQRTLESGLKLLELAGVDVAKIS
jgi:hypothetical protein